MLSVPRTLVAYTSLASIFAAVLLVYAGVVAAIAVFVPVLLHPLAGLAAVL